MAADAVDIYGRGLPAIGESEGYVSSTFAIRVAVGICTVPLGGEVGRASAGTHTGVVHIAVAVVKTVGKGALIGINGLGVTLGTVVIGTECSGIVDVGLVPSRADRGKARHVVSVATVTKR